MFSRIEETRLNYIRTNRISLAHERDPDLPDDEQIPIDLPASFLGSRRWASEHTADGLALGREFGSAIVLHHLHVQSRMARNHIAFTSKSKVHRRVCHRHSSFQLRFQHFKDVLRTKFGELKYMVSVIEFQKRGLPHGHVAFKVRCNHHMFLCLTLNKCWKVDPEIPIDRIDDLISCQLPSNNPQLREKIMKYMTHSKDHLIRETSRCRKNGVCIYGYPQPITPETWVDNETGRVHFKRLTEEDRWIVPHVPSLIDEFDCHIHFEVVFTVSIFMYLYKYMYKGPDFANVHVQEPGEEQNTPDELKDYVRCRYLSAPEAAWRILGFDVTNMEPSVTCLPIHLPGQNFPQFSQGRGLRTSPSSLLIRYFNRPTHALFDDIIYTSYYRDYTFTKFNNNTALREGDYLEQQIQNSPRYIVHHRQQRKKISRIQSVSPSLGEVFYLRALLSHRPARSFAELRHVNDVQYATFHEAAIQFGLFENTNEGFYALEEV